MRCENCSKSIDPATDRYIKVVDYPAGADVERDVIPDVKVEFVCCSWGCLERVIADGEERFES
jgi:hypothetical protein